MKQNCRFVVLTVDYEVFGNGTGDVREHVIAPAEQMALACEKHQVPLTLFFDVEEYLAFEREATRLKRDLGYDPAQLMREQAAALLARGHALQLHLHPQWHGARYEKGEWILRPEMHTVDDLFATPEQVRDYIAERKSVLEEIAFPSGHGLRVSAYRAGAFCARPGTRLLPGLAAAGVIIDSSVVHGLCNRNEHTILDYTHTPSGKRAWRVSNDVAVEDPAGPVWELPVTSISGRRIHQLGWQRLRAKFSRRIPARRRTEQLQQFGLGWNPIKVARFLGQKTPLKFDYHNVPPAKLYRWIKNYPRPASGELDLVVLIGHTKEHLNHRAFEQLLELVARDPELRVVSFSEVAEMLRAESKEQGAEGRQWTVDGGRGTVDGGRGTVDGRQWTVE